MGSGNCGEHSGSDLTIHITECQSNANWIPPLDSSVDVVAASLSSFEKSEQVDFGRFPQIVLVYEMRADVPCVRCYL